MIKIKKIIINLIVCLFFLEIATAVTIDYRNGVTDVILNLSEGKHQLLMSDVTKIYLNVSNNSTNLEIIKLGPADFKNLPYTLYNNTIIPVIVFEQFIINTVKNENISMVLRTDINKLDIDKVLLSSIDWYTADTSQSTTWKKERTNYELDLDLIGTPDFVLAGFSPSISKIECNYTCPDLRCENVTISPPDIHCPDLHCPICPICPACELTCAECPSCPSCPNATNLITSAAVVDKKCEEKSLGFFYFSLILFIIAFIIIVGNIINRSKFGKKEETVEWKGKKEETEWKEKEEEEKGIDVGWKNDAMKGFEIKDDKKNKKNKISKRRLKKKKRRN